MFAALSIIKTYILILYSPPVANTATGGGISITFLTYSTIDFMNYKTLHFGNKSGSKISKIIDTAVKTCKRQRWYIVFSSNQGKLPDTSQKFAPLYLGKNLPRFCAYSSHALPKYALRTRSSLGIRSIRSKASPAL